MSDIKPALTAEEWAEWKHLPWTKRGLFLDNLSDHGTAAVMLEGQPFGFTQEDVDRMNWLESGQEVCPKCGGSSWKLPARPICTGCGWRPCESSENFTDRIQSLLPVEKPA